MFDVFSVSLYLSECGKTLTNCLRSAKRKMNSMIAMIKTTKESQFKDEMHMNKLQKPVDLLALSLTNTRKTKSKKKKKKVLEDNNLKTQEKLAILDKQIDRQEHYSRSNCILLHGIPECKGEVSDDIAINSICQNINDNITTVDDIERIVK